MYVCQRYLEELHICTHVLLGLPALDAVSSGHCAHMSVDMKISLDLHMPEEGSWGARHAHTVCLPLYPSVHAHVHK